ncbi:MAG: ASCH domain-containing protein [Bacilli bacterium]|jgi:hypothetical protein|nr:ASCH domain-containing protein [Bacilli bacterium]
MIALIYVSKGGPRFAYSQALGRYRAGETGGEPLNGRVAAQFELEKAVEIAREGLCGRERIRISDDAARLLRGSAPRSREGGIGELLAGSRLTEGQTLAYMAGWSKVWGWLIQGLALYPPGDWQMDLSAYCKLAWRDAGEPERGEEHVRRPPQSRRYVTCFSDDVAGKVVLLFVRPEWAEKILNGEKTIELRKGLPEEVEAV